MKVYEEIAFRLDAYHRVRQAVCETEADKDERRTKCREIKNQVIELVEGLTPVDASEELDGVLER